MHSRIRRDRPPRRWRLLPSATHAPTCRERSVMVAVPRFLRDDAPHLGLHPRPKALQLPQAWTWPPRCFLVSGLVDSSNPRAVYLPFCKKVESAPGTESVPDELVRKRNGPGRSCIVKLEPKPGATMGSHVAAPL